MYCNTDSTDDTYTDAHSYSYNFTYANGDSHSYPE
jgi:hypothetical protein